MHSIKPSVKITTPILLITVILAMVMIITSVVLRIPKDEYIYVNQDAPWHVLHTMHSYDNIPVSEHLFLPLVTADDDARGLIWGATVESETGVFYYTSFWPSGFFVAWAFANIFGLPYVPSTLYILNSILYISCAILAAAVMVKLMRGILHPCFVVLSTIALYCFQPEVMQSQGAIYWHQSLTQVILLLQLFFFTQFSKKGGKIGFYICCFIAPLCEWSGHVANVGYALLFLVWSGFDEEKRSFKQRFMLAFGIGLTYITSVGLTVFHYTRRIALSDLFGALGLSYSVRGDSDWDPLLQYFVMLFRSHRPLWTIVGIIFIAVLILPKARKALIGMIKKFWPWAFVMAFPMLENFVLRQHAVEYTYDRMKVVVSLILIFLLLCACIKEQIQNTKKQQIAAVCTIGVCMVVGASQLWQYLQVPNYYVAIEEKVDANGTMTQNDYLVYNQLLADRILSMYPREDSFYGMGLQVRGYTNILWQGGLMEMVDIDQTIEEGMARGKRYIIFLKVGGGVSSTYRFIDATVYDTQTGEYIVHDPWNDYEYVPEEESA